MNCISGNVIAQLVHEQYGNYNKTNDGDWQKQKCTKQRRKKKKESGYHYNQRPLSNK